MKSNYVKVALALLSAVFILGCQELGSGPVGPDGLVPQFSHRPDSCKGHHKNEMGCNNPPTPPPPAPGELYSITMTGEISVDGMPPQGNENVVFNGITLDLSFLDDSGWMTGGCPMGPATGSLAVLGGGSPADGRLNFGFEQEGTGITHILWLYGTSEGTYPPVSGESFTMTADGRWMVISKGKNHRNACLGEGGGAVNGNNSVSWTLTLTGLPL